MGKATEDVPGRGNGRNGKRHDVLSEPHAVGNHQTPSAGWEWHKNENGASDLEALLGIWTSFGRLCVYWFVWVLFPLGSWSLKDFKVETDRLCILRRLLRQKFEE